MMLNRSIKCHLYIIIDEFPCDNFKCIFQFMFYGFLAAKSSYPCCTYVFGRLNSFVVHETYRERFWSNHNLDGTWSGRASSLEPRLGISSRALPPVHHNPVDEVEC
jgi:hypothetical protein